MNNYNKQFSEYQSYIGGSIKLPSFVHIPSVTHHTSRYKEPVPCQIYCNHARRYESVYQPGTQENPNYTNGFY